MQHQSAAATANSTDRTRPRQPSPLARRPSATGPPLATDQKAGGSSPPERAIVSPGHNTERDCQSRPGEPPAPGTLSTRKVGRAFESRSGRRYHLGTPPPTRRDPPVPAPIRSQTGVGSGWSARSRSDQGSASLPADWAGIRSPSGRGQSGRGSYDSCPLSRTSLVGVPAEKYRSSCTPYGSRYQPWARTSTLPW